MPKAFVHSVKVPRLYKSAAKIVREVRQKGGSLKTLIYEANHPNVSALYALCFNTLEREEELEQIIKKTELLVKESRFDPWLAKILIFELLWGKKILRSEDKPTKTILSYEQKLREALNDITSDEPLQIVNNKVKKPRYVRINTILVSLEKRIDSFQEEGWSLLPKCSSYEQHLNTVKSLEKPNFIRDFHIPELLVFPYNTTFHDHPGYKNGEIILQDKASCLSSHLLNPKSGSHVLDMCAAPGMKSTHLAALMENTGKIYSVEIDKKRYKILCMQVDTASASCIETINKDALTLESEDYAQVEYVLVDPTCSGSGMSKRQLHGKESYDPKRLKKLQAFQVFLLRHALFNFPKVKRVIYSTCSVNPEENEQVIDEILAGVHGAYELVPVKKFLNEEWLNFSSEKYKCLDKCLYARPETDLCNGFFLAVFERNFDVPLPEYKRKIKAVKQEVQVKMEEDAMEEMIEKPKEEKEKRKRKKRGKRKAVNQSANKEKDPECSKNEEMDDSNSINATREIELDDIFEDDNDESPDSDEDSDNNDDDASRKLKRKKLFVRL